MGFSVLELCGRKNPVMKELITAGLVLILWGMSLEAAEKGKHLFILSGQSNMQGHRPQEAFTPAVEKALGKEKIIVIQDALGGQPIQRWWKDWKSPKGDRPAQ